MGVKAEEVCEVDPFGKGIPTGPWQQPLHY